MSVAFMVALIAVITGWSWSRSGVIRDLTPAPVPLHPFGGIQDDPSFSPDGGQIAFTWRPPQSDNDDIYVVRIGDLEATRLTSHPALDKSPAWSPDGRQIAFIRRTGGTGEVLLISPAGGPEHKVVETEGHFRSDRTGAHQIWKMPVTGDAPSQVTRHGGFDALEASDGKSLYYVQGRYARGLWTVAVNGGQETKVPRLGSLTASSWTIIDNGILWIDVTASNPPAMIRFYDFATREVSMVTEVPGYVIPTATGFHAVRNGAVMMWSQLDRSAHDLMLVERFR